MRLRLVGLLSLCGLGCSRGSPPSSVSLYPTPSWSQPAGFSLRASGDGRALLLRQVGSAVYEYSAAGGFKSTSLEQWEQGQVETNCDQQLPSFTFSETTHDGGSRFSGGRVLLTTRLSPSKRLLAVVTAASLGSSLMPFLGRGHVGPFHHQVVTADTETPVGAEVALPFGKRTSALLVCWSADERFVVYSDLIMSGVAIVEVGR